MDNRMQWILFLEQNFQSGKDEVCYTDYEICSEVRIPGVLEYRDKSLICGLLSEVDERGLYSYTIRVKHVMKPYFFDKSAFSKEGYYFPDGIIGELMAIFSVFFQARFFLKSSVSGQFSPTSLNLRNNMRFSYVTPKKGSNFEMFTSQNRNWAYENGLCAFLDTLWGLDQKYHQGIIRSFHWYAEAIKEIGVDHELFYIKMVSCIEALLDFDEMPSDALHRKVVLFLGSGTLGNKQKKEMESWLKHRKIQSRFVNFIKAYSMGYFKQGYRKAKHCYIKKGHLGTFLKRIYSARSGYLHSGKPMFISFDMEMGTDSSDKKCHLWDLAPVLGMKADRGFIGKDALLPRVRWFERMVNHCLKHFLRTRSPST